MTGHHIIQPVPSGSQRVDETIAGALADAVELGRRTSGDDRPKRKRRPLRALADAVELGRRTSGDDRPKRKRRPDEAASAWAWRARRPAVLRQL